MSESLINENVSVVISFHIKNTIKKKSMFELATFFFFQFTDTGYKQENECFIYCLLNLQGNLFFINMG